MRRKYSIEVDCANCAREVEEAISGLKKVEKVSISFVDKTMLVDAGADTEEEFDAIERSIEATAHSVEPDFAMGPFVERDVEGGGEPYIKARVVFGLAVLAAGLILKYVLPDTLDGLDEGPARWGMAVLFFASMLVVGYNVYVGAARNVAHARFFDENFLMSVATLGAVAVSCFEDGGAYYVEGLAVLVFYEIGEIFQNRAVDRSRASVKALVDLKAPYATVVRGGEAVKVKPEEVAVGEEIVVAAGEKVPVDGIVVEGSSFLDTKALTGESVPRRAERGDEVLSGCINTDGALHIRASRPYRDSAAARVLSLIEESAARKSTSEKFITRFARHYTPAVVALALALMMIPPLALGWTWEDSVYKGLIVLVVSCPCALVVSVPLSYYCGIGRASRDGILVKGSMYIETLSKVDTVVFDKTGTLTMGEFEVSHVHPVEMGGEEFVDLAACAEAYSSHPIAKSIRGHHGNAPDPARVSDAREVPGKGVCANVDGHVVYVGNEVLMRDIDIAETLDCGVAGTDVHLSVDGRYAGHIVISDRLKEDAARAVSALRASGIRNVVMLTGDNIRVGKDISDRLGLDGFEAELMPGDKTRHLDMIIRGAEGGVAFVGDGINDAPALALADVGIAMGDVGSDAAVEAADVVIIDDDPAKVVSAINIGKRTQRIVAENIAMALAVKFAVLAVTPFWTGMNMWVAIFGDVGVLIIAVLNAVRALGYSRRGTTVMGRGGEPASGRDSLLRIS